MDVVFKELWKGLREQSYRINQGLATSRSHILLQARNNKNNWKIVFLNPRIGAVMKEGTQQVHHQCLK